MLNDERKSLIQLIFGLSLTKLALVIGIMITIIASNLIGFNLSSSITILCSSFLTQKYEIYNSQLYSTSFLSILFNLILCIVIFGIALSIFLKIRNGQQYQPTSQTLKICVIFISFQILATQITTSRFLSLIIEKGRCTSSIQFVWITILILSFITLIVGFINWLVSIKWLILLQDQEERKKKSKKEPDLNGQWDQLKSKGSGLKKGLTADEIYQNMIKQFNEKVEQKERKQPLIIPQNSLLKVYENQNDDLKPKNAQYNYSPKNKNKKKSKESELIEKMKANFRKIYPFQLKKLEKIQQIEGKNVGQKYLQLKDMKNSYNSIIAQAKRPTRIAKQSPVVIEEKSIDQIEQDENIEKLVFDRIIMQQQNDLQNDIQKEEVKQEAQSFIQQFLKNRGKRQQKNQKDDHQQAELKYMREKSNLKQKKLKQRKRLFQEQVDYIDPDVNSILGGVLKGHIPKQIQNDDGNQIHQSIEIKRRLKAKRRLKEKTTDQKIVEALKGKYPYRQNDTQVQET